MRLRLAAIAALIALTLAPSSSAWNKYATLDEVASWLAMRPVYAQCLNKWESERDFVILIEGAAAYVDGMFEQDGRWHPDDHMVVAYPICTWFNGLARGDADGFSANDVAFSVLVVVHESGHLRGWNRKTLVSDDEASTERWALRHVYAVAKRIGLSDEAAVFVLREAVVFHKRLPEEYHAEDCVKPYVDAAGVLRRCGK